MLRVALNNGLKGFNRVDTSEEELIFLREQICTRMMGRCVYIIRQGYIRMGSGVMVAEGHHRGTIQLRDAYAAWHRRSPR